ncbi:RING-H2 finger protein ATL72 [Ananas comosus]|uniref:RING-H2 finger protein ATL72 n=1 Tax=Ananas comosus TaxID=4615 RepID=A0A199UDY5_ANACO|nr:RING-H2 finger protein ATL72 [Ananas comosus]
MSTTTNSNSKSNWGPYAGAADFGANMGIILAALFAAVALALSANAAIRFLLSRHRRRSRQHPQPADADPEKQQQDQQQLPPPPPPSVLLTFSSAAAVKSSECAICLTEFAEGDRVRVLPACAHGFHGGCVESWWLQSAAPARRQSCPTCRASCCLQTATAPAGGGAS